MNIIFTICSINYLAQAKALGESINKHNSNYTFLIVLVDKISQKPDIRSTSSSSIIEVEDLGIAELDAMCSLYNITELNTAVKPFAFHYFFDHFPEASTCIYFDPDILVYNPLTDLEILFKENDIILTPHITKPIEDEYFPRETDFLNAGLYNLGFIALKRSQNVFDFLHWWMSRLKDQCRIDFLNGLFVDQLWINFVPLFYKKVHILQHPGYNMAYWNLHERKLSGSDGNYFVNEVYPLVFFHFSGYKIEKPYALSNYQNRFNFIIRPDLTQLFIRYSELVADNHHSEFSKITCYYYPPEKKTIEAFKKKESRSVIKRNLLRITNYCFFYLKSKF